MKILHLFSDQHKTGPAEPVIGMCRGLIDRGHEVLLAYREGGSGRLGRAIRQADIPATTRFALNRYLHPIDTARDLLRLPKFLKRERFDIVHTHLRHDQMLGLVCGRLAGSQRPRLINTLHRRHVLPNRWAYRQLLRRCDGVTAFTPGFRRAHLDRFDLDPRRIDIIPPTADAQRFDPARSYRDMRQQFNIPPDAVVIGIVGRFQTYRRMDVFLEAARLLIARAPEARFLVIGRSRSRKQTVDEPVRRLGLEQHVIIAGYRTDDYIDTLAALDIFTLLMPGSDGTARAVREAMAMARPCVVGEYGMLPELVPDREAGRVSPIQPRPLADAWFDLVADADRRKQMGRCARRIAEQQFNPAAAVERLERFYEQILALPPV